MVLMVFVLVGTIRRWIELMNIKSTVNDAYGEPVRALAEE